ncbi:zinc-binding dehydrogenase [Actinomyces ruminicola]|uniref:zinc-binding dehydrogenase n=1 Tax=Actinomyces ruminicola TaxID=332524 RepID=UPI0011C92CBA|nr:zinc-binding dehydrogenase [Actinomyces ruminicola]
MPDTMTALLLDRPAGPDELSAAMRLGRLPFPEPGPGQVRLRVEACSLNPVDWKVARGGNPAWTWPHVLGLDVAGTVDALGPGVATPAEDGATALRPDLAVGDTVALHHDLRRPGGLAQYVVVDALALAHLPDAVSATDAAALPCAGMTAYHALTRRVRLAAGQTILITAGAGGVGGYAVQIAHHLGARVIATAPPDKVRAVRALGADEVIDYRAAGDPDAVAAAARALTPQGRGVDAVLDTLDGASATANLGALAFNGALAFIGGRPDLSAMPGFTISPSIHEVSLGAAYSAGTARDRADLATMLTEMLELVAAGRLDARVAETVPLDAVPAAYAQLARGHQAGKLVCDVAGSAVAASS